MINISLEIDAGESTRLMEDLESKVRKLPEWVAEFTKEKIYGNWEKGLDPVGVPWAPLAKSTIESRRKRNIQGLIPLIATRTMINSMRVENDGESYQVVVDHPAQIHQSGTSRIPQRKLAPEGELPDSWRKGIEEFVGKVLSGVVE